MEIEKCCKNCKYLHNDNYGYLIHDMPHYQCKAYLEKSFNRVSGTKIVLSECFAVSEHCTKFELTNKLKLKQWFKRIITKFIAKD